MRNYNQKHLYLGLSALAAFFLWTAALQFIDVQAIGPRESSVGFATVNRCIHNFTGVHMTLYIVTDWLGLVPIFFALGFAILGLVQWIKRKSILRVDGSILVLGGFYLIVFAAYLYFEMNAINFRPVLINGYLEASYPSSTTLLVMCVMPTAILQLNSRIKNILIRRSVASILVIFIRLMVIGRFISGVHWFSDIVGGALLSVGLVMLYHFFCGYAPSGKSEHR